MKYALVFVTLVAAAAATAMPAHADSRSAKAEALFRQGRDLMAAGKLADACAAFDASQKLDPATTTLFNQADCREKNGQLATAWGLFVDAERQTRAAADDTGKKLHTVAQSRAQKLEERLSHITIQLASRPAGLVVLRGNEVVEPGEYGREMPIDGGTYTYSARIGDREVWSETIAINMQADRRILEVKPRDVKTAPVVPPVATPAVQTQPATSVTTTATPTTTRSTTNAKIATAGAMVLLGGALAFELWGQSIYTDAKAMHSEDLRGQANTRRYLAEGMLVGGLAVGATAVYLWMRRGSETPSRGTAIAPMAGNGVTGFALEGRF